MTQPQLKVLQRLAQGSKLCVRQVGCKLVGYIDKDKVCSEITWRVLLKNDYIKPVTSFVYVITSSGKDMIDRDKI